MGDTMHSLPLQRTPIAQGFSLVDSCSFKIRTVDEAAQASAFAAHFFRDPEKIRNGLFELMLNAIEHGCLGIGHHLKSRLIANKSWQLEIMRRQSLPENRQKHTDVVFARKNGGIVVVVTDPGTGFDWKPWLSLDPARAADAHGRGIARARNLSFDALVYNEKGNQAVAQSNDVIDKAW